MTVEGSYSRFSGSNRAQNALDHSIVGIDPLLALFVIVRHRFGPVRVEAIDYCLCNWIPDNVQHSVCRFNPSDRLIINCPTVRMSVPMTTREPLSSLVASLSVMLLCPVLVDSCASLEGFSRPRRFSAHRSHRNCCENCCGNCSGNCGNCGGETCCGGNCSGDCGNSVNP